MAKRFYNHYLESGNNVEMKLDDNAEHGFVNIRNITRASNEDSQRLKFFIYGRPSL